MKLSFRFIVSSVVFVILITAGFLILSASAKSFPPGIDEVLRKSAEPFNWTALLIGFFALSLSTLSAAKAYELFKKSTPKDSLVLPKMDDSVIDSLKSEIGEISSDIRRKEEENNLLKDQIKNMEHALQERIASEDILKKSVTGLRRECEKLLSEKEQLTLEVNRHKFAELFSAPVPVIETEKPVAKKIKTARKEVNKPTNKKAQPKIKAKKRKK